MILQMKNKALRNKQDMVLVDLPNDKEVMGLNWVYKVKYKSDSSIKKIQGKVGCKGIYVS